MIIRSLIAACAVLVAGLIGTASARAQEPVPVPSVVIYPLATITPDMLTTASLSPPVLSSSYYMVRQDIVGKMAKQTLLPGRPIPIVALMTPRLFPQGARIHIIFEADGISASALGIALDAGSEGDIIRVRNSDSNLIVTGRVEGDGAVHVGMQ